MTDAVTLEERLRAAIMNSVDGFDKDMSLDEQTELVLDAVLSEVVNHPQS